MSDNPINGHSKPALLSPQARAAISNEIRTSTRHTLRQACDLKDLAYKVAMQMEQVWDDPELADRERARAMAITSLTKSWAEAVDISRIVRGKPLPGSKRPPPDTPKPRKQAQLNTPSEQ